MCWPAKLAAELSSSTTEDRTANGGVKASMAFVTFSMAVLSPEANLLVFSFCFLN